MDLPFEVIWCVSMNFIRLSRSSFRVILHPDVQSNPKVKAAKNDAFKESVEWLIKYMQ